MSCNNFEELSILAKKLKFLISVSSLLKSKSEKHEEHLYAKEKYTYNVLFSFFCKQTDKA